MAIARRLVAAFALIAGVARPGLSQQLRGTISDSASRGPIAGAVLLLLDSAGTTLGRNITDDRGQYRMVISPNVRRLRVVRIGFRPRVVRVDPGVTQLDVVMVAIPTMLEPVQVRSGANCSRRSDRATAFALLEQARAGLLATVVAREANPAQMVRLRFTRRMQEASDRVQSQEVHLDSSDQVTASFRAARTTSDFIRLGFAKDSAGMQKFYGPDAEVMLDEALADGYCFHLSDRERARPNQIGLAFTPASRRLGRIDIEGALWIDTLARELRDIEFHYLGLPSAFDAFRPGGRVVFRAMANGVVLIDRWSFRLVGSTADTIRGRETRSIRAHLFAIESGGEVASAIWPDGFSWRGTLGTLLGRTVDQNGTPLSGTIVGLTGTNYGAIADSRGQFEISNLLPGPYTATVLDSTLGTLGIALKTSLAFTATRDSTVQTALRVPTAKEFVIDACVADGPTRRNFVDEHSTKLIGRVVSSAGTPVAGARLRLSIEGVEKDWILVAFDGKTGSDGLFHWCNGMPLRRRLEIEVKLGGDPAHVTRLELTREVTVVRIELPPRP